MSLKCYGIYQLFLSIILNCFKFTLRFDFFFYTERTKHQGLSFLIPSAISSKSELGFMFPNSKPSTVSSVSELSIYLPNGYGLIYLSRSYFWLTFKIFFYIFIFIFERQSIKLKENPFTNDM